MFWVRKQVWIRLEFGKSVAKVKFFFLGFLSLGNFEGGFEVVNWWYFINFMSRIVEDLFTNKKRMQISSNRKEWVLGFNSSFREIG